jgi:hypothetical protein
MGITGGVNVLSSGAVGVRAQIEALGLELLQIRRTAGITKFA